MELIETKDFDADEKTRGLGKSYRYEGGSLLKADVYVYDKQMKNLISGTDSPEAAAEIRSVPQVLAKMQELGKYKEVKDLGSGEKIYGGVKFLWCRHSYSRALGDGSQSADVRVSDTFIRISGGKFLKVRITTLEKDLAKDQKEMDLLMAEVARQG